MRIDDHLRTSAARHADKTALVTPHARLTYAALDRRSDALAGALARAGIARGDRVALLLDNRWEAAVAIYAVAKAGGVFCPLNPSTKPDKLAYVLRDSGAAALIVEARLAATAAAALAEVPTVRAVFVAGGAATLPGAIDLHVATAGPAAAPPCPGIALDLAMLVYTSGSTGRPKGVMMTHANVDAAATAITTYLRGTPEDVVLCVLPLAFDYGLYQLLMTVRLGATLVLGTSFAYPHAVLETARRERVTGLPLVPTMAAMLLRAADLAPDALPDLRYLTNTAAALPTPHIERLQALFPRAALYSMYGLTECKRCTWLPPEELGRRPGSVGIAIPGTEAWIVDESGERVSPGVVGELVVRGPHVMQGYWGDPDATARALRPGAYPWEQVLHTGDLFRADEEGFLYFVARKDDIIKTRGEKVAPKEVEAVLHACPGVAEAVVVGVPDPILGHAVHALVVPSDPGLTERDVLRHCAARLEDFMVPKRVTLRESLPRTDTGKVSRRLAAQEEREIAR